MTTPTREALASLLAAFFYGQYSTNEDERSLRLKITAALKDFDIGLGKFSATGQEAGGVLTPVAWQFRFVFADGKKGAWSQPLDMPRNIENGDRKPGSDTTFDVRDLYAGPTGGGAFDVGAMVNRFLGWRLPDTFGPDCYITFDRERAKANGSWPVGTNLLSASEASAMFAHVLTRPTPAADLTDERIQQIAASIPVDPAGKGDEWFPVFARAIEAELVAASPVAAAGVPTGYEWREDAKAFVRHNANGTDTVLTATSEREELERLRALVHSPHTDDFMEAVRLEAAHQQERWGTDHDAGKGPTDWFWLLGYLSGKALTAFLAGDRAKGRHHIISSAAMLLNWHGYETRQHTARMRPGIEPHGAFDSHGEWKDKP